MSDATISKSHDRDYKHPRNTPTLTTILSSRMTIAVIVITVLFVWFVGIYLVLDHNTHSTDSVVVTFGNIDMMEMIDRDMEMPMMMDIDMSMMDMMMTDENGIKLIHMGMNMFMPNELQVQPDTTVSWETHDRETHNISGIFKTDSGKEIPILSGDIAHMEQWSYTFEESGVFEYICGYHEGKGMKGKLVVIA